jgi:hypothetical protein
MMDFTHEEVVSVERLLERQPSSCVCPEQAKDPVEAEDNQAYQRRPTRSPSLRLAQKNCRASPLSIPVVASKGHSLTLRYPTIRDSPSATDAALLKGGPVVLPDQQGGEPASAASMRHASSTAAREVVTLDELARARFR